ncbi:unnamed protein product [Meganyctiphanes norvegica]|uniref:AAA+ ATPase domain-containing protein n=1 Tax=Meganyctiphanes norvegica TaxID=48144 RepID=A0AAV2QDB0_MEGNR
MPHLIVLLGWRRPNRYFKKPLLCPHITLSFFKSGTKPWTRMLLYGPPGTGKTRLAKALANELKCTFFCVSPASLLSCLIGESEKLIRDLFKTARNESGQSVIFFDEIDSLCRRRTQNEDEHTRRVKTELLRQIEGIENSGDSKVFLLGATNCPWDLDNAFLRRFQRRIYTPLPDRESRQAIISHHLNSLELTESEWSQLLDATDGYSGADISHMTMAASFQPIRELHTNRFWTFTSNNKIMPCSSDTLGAMQYTFSSLPPAQVMSRSVKLSDFITAAKSTPRTVSQEMLFKYEEYHQAPYQ